MAYAKQVWTPNVTPVDAAHLNHIEDGIAAVDAKPSSGATYIGVYDPAHTYQDGDYVIGPDGVTYVCVIGGTVGVTPTPWAPAPTIPIGTTLPAAPVDGMEAILVDSLTLPTYQWRFRYNAASTSAHKWGFVGGPPALLRCPDFTPTGVGAWQMAAGSFSIPRSGHYIFEVTCQPNSPAASVQYHGIALDGTILDPYCGVSLAAGYSAGLRSRAQIDCSAGQTVQGACNSGYTLATFYCRDLSMQPVRVA